MNNKILPLFILDDSNKTLFDKDKYIIPLYQRAFAWSDKEICQLIDDINDFTADHYYLGSLIVYLNQDGIYEVIDGQQRLTALFLLLDYVRDYNWGKNRLGYECRERSNYTLNCLAELSNDNIEPYFANAEKIEQSLINGRKIIDDKFRMDKKIIKEKFIANLKKVILYRIEVPPHTDLNRYFEIMNVRGEQLEQHDILKAKLMEQFGEDCQKCNAFAKIWNACRDMSGYVQMHFSTKSNDREKLFGRDWSSLYLDDFIKKLNADNEKPTSYAGKGFDGLTALEIISRPQQRDQAGDGTDEDGKQVRFDSIINFPFFLLHVLRVFTRDTTDNSRIPLDDAKLVKTFEDEIKKSGDGAHFAFGFIQCLLKCRFLFDKYVIKREREYKAEDKNGQWSLKEIHNYKGKARYTSTEFKNKREQNKTYENLKQKRHGNMLMLQSCLRVSDTSPKSMPWITLTLKWLNDNFPVDKPAALESEIENYVKSRIKEDYTLLEKEKFVYGVATPHLFLNYLDYLLWKDNRDNGTNMKLHFDDFSFEFRNSVEHWYPQHPAGFNSWEDIDENTKRPLRDRFGNLCLVSREVNSKFSNAPPVAKTSFDEIIKKGSLKLRLMSYLTLNVAKDNARWKDNVCGEHEKEMLNLLRNACNMPIIP